MNLNVLIGTKITGPNAILTFTNGIIFVKAEFRDAATNEVVIELPVQNWDKATAALCTFLEVNGEPRKSIMNKVNKIIDGITKKDFAVSE
jgi:hypothetical protein